MRDPKNQGDFRSNLHPVQQKEVSLRQCLLNMRDHVEELEEDLHSLIGDMNGLTDGRGFPPELADNWDSLLSLQNRFKANFVKGINASLRELDALDTSLRDHGKYHSFFTRNIVYFLSFNISVSIT